MMCYRPKEQFPAYHILQENNAALRFFINSLKELQSKSNPDPYEIYYLLRWTWKIIGYNDASIDKILQKPERRIMRIESIEGLIETTTGKIKTALDSNKPEEAKVYTEMLVLLRQTINVPQESRIDKLFKEFNRNESLRNSGGNIDKPFEKISEKHIPDV